MYQMGNDMRLWTLGAKVTNVDREVAFVQAIGGSTILPDDQVILGGRTYRIPLVRWGTTRLHLADEMVYESTLGHPLNPGLAHVVFEVDDLESSRQKALAAGAREVAPPSMVEAGFGTRQVAFFQSPGGILFEFINILEDRVGDR